MRKLLSRDASMIMFSFSPSLSLCAWCGNIPLDLTIGSVAETFCGCALVGCGGEGRGRGRGGEVGQGGKAPDRQDKKGVQARAGRGVLKLEGKNPL